MNQMNELAMAKCIKRQSFLFENEKNNKCEDKRLIVNKSLIENKKSITIKERIFNMSKKIMPKTPKVNGNI